jgi:DNA-directed RNA polymerase subunit N (RpoN/RPB10)
MASIHLNLPDNIKMYPRITCTCGYCIGGVYAAYMKMVAARVAEKKADTIAPEFAGLVDDGVRVADILDSLQITAQCCRAMMMTQVSFLEVYGDSPRM